MKRLFSILATSAALFAFSLSGASAATHGSAMHNSMHGTKMHHSCPAGKHWVKGYMKNGKMVKGYCRK